MFESLLGHGARRLRTLALLAGAGIALAAQAASTAAPVFAPITAVISTGAPAYSASFVAPASETVDVTLIDLATTSGNTSGLTALSAVNLVVTANGAVVAGATAGTTATLAAPGTVSFAATANTTYQIYAVGVPNPSATSANAISVQAASHSAGTSYSFGTYSFVLPNSTVPQSVYFAPTAFSIPATGDYVVTLSDQAVPVALTNLLALVKADAPNSPSIPALTPGTTTLHALAAGTYKVYVYAVADATVQAGLFGISIVPAAGGGAAPLDRSIAVGLLKKAGGTDVTTPTAQSLTLTATDLHEPAALNTLSAAVTQGATLLGKAAAGQSTTLSASAGALQVWQLVAAAAGGAGAYQISVAPASGAALYAPVAVVRDPAGSVYPYVATVPTAGNYVPALTDQQFPAAFATLGFQLYQGGTLLGQGNAGTTAAAQALAAGPAVLVVNAVPPAGGDGVYAVALTPAAGGAPTFAQVQPVGANLTTVPFVIPADGSYDIALADLGWPAAFQGSIAGLIAEPGVTQGAGFPIKIYGTATATGTVLPAGNYVATINGTPATGQVAGLYSLTVTPSVPVVTLTASPASFATGTGTRLTWSSTGASACTASATGPVPASTTFKGTQALSGTDSEGPFATAGSVVYTLTCTGAGGSATASATVTVTGTSSSGGGGGGGGAAGLADLLLLAAAIVARRLAR